MADNQGRWSLRNASIVYWVCVVLAPLTFLLPISVFWALAIVAIEIVIYGSHEALHATVNRRPIYGMGELAAVLGFAVQGMNFYLLRPAHMRHHQLGRYDQGYAPDVLIGVPKLWQRIHYYAVLIGVAGVAYQLAGLGAIRGRWDKRFRSAKVTYAKWGAAQLAVIVFFLISFELGGPMKVLIFETVFVFLWSLQQNVSHYGIQGIDAVTDRVCAYTYYLPWPLNMLTFGSTSHLLHHARPDLDGSRLYDRLELEAVERKLGIEVAEKTGLRPFIFDLLRQFRGPVRESDLSVDWIEDVQRARTSKAIGSFGYRQGRVYADQTALAEGDVVDV